jgi:Ca2+-binding RTX toxin-like protein
VRIKILLLALVLLLPAQAVLAGAPTCTYGSVSGVATLRFEGAPSVELRTFGDEIQYRSGSGDPFQQCDGATTENTNLVRVIDDSSDARRLVVDLSFGPLAPGRAAESRGTSEIEVRVAGAGAGEGPFGLTLEGTSGRDLIAAGTKGAKWNRDRDRDIHIDGLTTVDLLGDHGRDKVDLTGGNGVGPHFPVRPDPDLFASGGKGPDRVIGGPTDDFLVGGDGRDQVIGKRGRDKVQGRDGFDHLKGSKGRDSLYGNAGNDDLDGDAGNDYLESHSGDDALDGDEGDDTCIGGVGDDRLRRCERNT